MEGDEENEWESIFFFFLALGGVIVRGDGWND